MPKAGFLRLGHIFVVQIATCMPVSIAILIVLLWHRVAAGNVKHLSSM